MTAKPLEPVGFNPNPGPEILGLDGLYKPLREQIESTMEIMFFSV
jgi:hypothetical protein